MYSQFEEEKIISNYFNYDDGFLIDIGANDGKTFSNSLRMIERGWSGICIEPTSVAYNRLNELHKNRTNVNCLNCAITEKKGENWIIVNGSHYSNDSGLLSQVKGEDFDINQPIPKDVYGWKNYEKIKTQSFETLTNENEIKKVDLILIDAEGYDYNILQQINLKKLDVKMVVVETDNSIELENKYQSYFSKFGFKLYNRTIVNLIYTL